MKLFKAVLYFFFIIFTFCYTTFAQEDDLLTLKRVITVFRHGDRTPTALWPSFSNPNEKFLPIGLGELTNRGKMTEFNLGKALRKRYDTFLGPSLYKEDVKAKSSDIKRTKESLMLVLAGLYPPKDDQVWNNQQPTIDWQPYAFNYTEFKRDKEFFGAYCTNYKSMFEEYRKSKEFKAYERKHAFVTQQLKKYAGFQNATYLDGYTVYFDFICLENMNIKLPEWSKYIYPSPLDIAVADYYNAKAFNKVAIQYAGGFLMKEILSDIHNHIEKNEPTNTKLSLYSGHEITVAYLLIVLGVYENERPALGSYISLELHKVNGIYGIKILLENYTKPTIQVKTIPNCSTICPLEQLEELIKDHLPNDQLACAEVKF